MKSIPFFFSCNGRSGSFVVAGCRVSKSVSNPICLCLWTGPDKTEKEQNTVYNGDCKKVRLATVVEGDSKAPSLIAI